MKRKQTVLIALAVLVLLGAGLLLPGLAEWITDRSGRGVQTRETEVISFDGGDSSVVEILNRINSYRDGENSASDGRGILEFYLLDEGYNYTRDQAYDHAWELLSDFLQSCGFAETDALYQKMELRAWEVDPQLLMGADYPTPWSSIVWMCDFYMEDAEDKNVMVVFDDASGALLTLYVPLIGEEIPLAQEETDAGLLELTGACSEQYAKMLDVDLAYGYETEFSFDEEPEDGSVLNGCLYRFSVSTEYGEDAVCVVNWLREYDGTVSLEIGPYGGL